MYVCTCCLLLDVSIGHPEASLTAARARLVQSMDKTKPRPIAPQASTASKPPDVGRAPQRVLPGENYSRETIIL